MTALFFGLTAVLNAAGIAAVAGGWLRVHTTHREAGCTRLGWGFGLYGGAIYMHSCDRVMAAPAAYLVICCRAVFVWLVEPLISTALSLILGMLFSCPRVVEPLGFF